MKTVKTDGTEYIYTFCGTETHVTVVRVIPGSGRAGLAEWDKSVIVRFTHDGREALCRISDLKELETDVQPSDDS